MCSETTEEFSTLKYLNRHFRLSDPAPWAVGNHDVRNGNTEWITGLRARSFAPLPIGDLRFGAEPI
ncbi:MAG: hypothetical protein R3C61_15030 [Bacteroidia bacterium]